MRVKILFVCHGNICRSPMAAMVFRYLAQQRHVSGEFEVDSAALSNEEIGNGIYPPARRILVKHGVPCTEHRARQITPEDFETADLIIGMECEQHVLFLSLPHFLHSLNEASQVLLQQYHIH